MRLGVNIDHIATLRQQRRGSFPDPIIYAQEALESGADSIVCHLREDRRHIQDTDLARLKACVPYLNLEIALSSEMMSIIQYYAPERITLVPEKREELTTENGLNLKKISAERRALLLKCTEYVKAVSLFLDPDPEQIDLVQSYNVSIIELNTARYSESVGSQRQAEYERLKRAVLHAHLLGYKVVAGHGLTFDHAEEIKSLSWVEEVNIGFFIVSHALNVGWSTAIEQIKKRYHR